jgi:hypothetical protein
MKNNVARSKRGGKRENAGRKPIWNSPDTCTIRVPKIYAKHIMQLAHRLDSGETFDTITKSNSDEQPINTNDDRFSQSELEIKDIITESLPINNQSNEEFDNVTKSIPLLKAISTAKKVLRHKKSARISIAKLISKLYNQNFSPENLK